MLLAEFYSGQDWNLQKFGEWVPENIAKEIYQFHLYLAEKDRLVWLLSALGDFTLKTAWELVQQRRNVSKVDYMCWTSLLIKVSFLAWRVLRSAVPLDLALHHWEVVLASSYQCCRVEEESIDHVFLHRLVARWYGIISLGSSAFLML